MAGPGTSLENTSLATTTFCPDTRLPAGLPAWTHMSPERPVTPIDALATQRANPPCRPPLPVESLSGTQVCRAPLQPPCPLRHTAPTPSALASDSSWLYLSRPFPLPEMFLPLHTEETHSLLTFKSLLKRLLLTSAFPASRTVLETRRGYSKTFLNTY